MRRSVSGLTSKVSTTYFKPDGTKFGHLISEFKSKPYLPDSEFEDLRFGRKYIGKLKENNGKSVYLVEEYKNEKLLKSTSIEIKGDLISGPGFDNFISEEIVKSKDQNKPVHFLVLPRHSDYRFNVCALNDGSLFKQYKIKPSTLLSLFVKEIVISYDLKTSLLKRYEGLSNLPSDKDESQNVVIDYE